MNSVNGSLNNHILELPSGGPSALKSRFPLFVSIDQFLYCFETRARVYESGRQKVSLAGPFSEQLVLKSRYDSANLGTAVQNAGSVLIWLFVTRAVSLSDH